MKMEISIEEKARRYDEAYKKVAVRFGSNVADEIFPELKESEGEKIRKELISFVRGMLVCHDKPYAERDEKYESWIAWLEKQYEHSKFYDSIQVGDKVTRNEDGVLVNLSQLKRVAKPADKVEPKFKVGDFIVNDYCMGRIVEITNDAYLLDTEQGIPFSCHSTRLWDISKDAKDGDVLATKKGNPFIYDKNRYNNGLAYYYAGLDVNKELTLKSPHHMLAHFGELSNVFPATKEQHDILFQKMKESGYIWDVEKKELKKIIDEEQIKKNLQDNSFRRMFEQKTAWSAEDERIYKVVLELMDSYSKGTIGGCIISPNIDRYIKWFKSLKDRVFPQPKQEWSEEDEEMYKEVLTDIIYAKNNLEAKECLGLSKRAMEAFNWFSKRYKSFILQNTWKPSDEQIKVCKEVYADILSAKGFDLGTVNSELNRLEEELKKLKG